MKTIIACLLAGQLIITAFTIWICWQFGTAAQEAAVALTKASTDYREAYQQYHAERVRIASMLEQFSKDATRMRSYLQRKGG